MVDGVAGSNNGKVDNHKQRQHKTWITYEQYLQQTHIMTTLPDWYVCVYQSNRLHLINYQVHDTHDINSRTCN